MSRTNRGSKCVGYDYWSARPLNKGGGLAGKWTKKFTARIERRNAKKLASDETNEELLKERGHYD